MDILCIGGQLSLVALGRPLTVGHRWSNLRGIDMCIDECTNLCMDICVDIG